jgi:hypothetical protein
MKTATNALAIAVLICHCGHGNRKISVRDVSSDISTIVLALPSTLMLPETSPVVASTLLIVSVSSTLF